MSEELAHLEAAHRAHAGLSDDERIDWIRQDRWIHYARADQVVARLVDLLTYPPRDRMPWAAPEADPVLDWFHIAMRWQHVHQLATGAIHQGQTAARTWLLDRIERAKWALWNGQLSKTLGHLSELRVWTWNARADPSWLEHLRTHLSELTSYLDANADSLPNYGARYRAGTPISTAFAESAVNQIIATRMIKRQQMRWNRETVQPFLTVRVAVLNETLERAFRSWHAGFRPVEGPARREHPTQLHALSPGLLVQNDIAVETRAIRLIGTMSQVAFRGSRCIARTGSKLVHR